MRSSECLLVTDRVSRQGKAIGSGRPSVCLSVRLSVRLFPFYLLNRPTFKVEFFVYVWVITLARMRWKVRVIDQG